MKRPSLAGIRALEEAWTVIGLARLTVFGEDGRRMGEELELHEGIRPVEREWDELAVRVGSPPFLRPAWLSAWWSAFGSGELLVLALRRDGGLAGVLPVCRRGSVLSSPSNYHTPVYGPVLEDQAAGKGLLDGLFELGPRRVQLSFASGRAGWLRSFRTAAAEAGYQVTPRTMFRSPYIQLSAGWDAYWAARSVNLRRGTKRLFNRLQDRGSVSLRMVRGEQGLSEQFEDALTVEASGWKGQNGTAIASRPETRRFYGEIARWGAREGMLRLTCLRVDETPVAMHLALEADGSHMVLKEGYDEGFAKVGPGKLLARDMIERAFNLGLDTFDFLGKEEPHKEPWADHVDDRVEVQAFKRSPVGLADRLVRVHGRSLARRVSARVGR